MIRSLVHGDLSGYNAEAGLERSETEGRNCWKNQVKEDCVLDWDLGSGDGAKWIDSRSIWWVEYIELSE